MPDPAEIVTPRLLLRRWRPADRAPFAALNADPDVMRYLPAPMDRAASDATADRIEAQFGRDGWGLWALELRADATFIGFTGLQPVPEDLPVDGRVEIGWRLAAAAWHRGYATEAARAAVRFGFLVVGLREIVSFTAELNAPSEAVMRRIGMARQGRFEHPRLPPGHPLRPHVLYRLHRKDWQPDPPGGSGSGSADRWVRDPTPR